MKLLKQLLAIATLLISTQVFAEAVPGRDYTVMGSPVPTRSGEKIEVLEFFFYGCSHCYHLHPHLMAWEKKAPKDVALQLVPTIFRDSWEPMARTFYALEAVGQQLRLHDELFKAWNVTNTDLSDEAKIGAWVAQRGVDRTKFAAAYNSFSMGSKVSRSNQMVRDFGIRGTPSIVVDGKFVITGLSPEVTIQVLNDVVARARKERSKR